jgi:hypothetical protein
LLKDRNTRGEAVAERDGECDEDTARDRDCDGDAARDCNIDALAVHELDRVGEADMLGSAAMAAGDSRGRYMLHQRAALFV